MKRRDAISVAPLYFTGAILVSALFLSGCSTCRFRAPTPAEAAYVRNVEAVCGSIRNIYASAPGNVEGGYRNYTLTILALAIQTDGGLTVALMDQAEHSALDPHWGLNEFRRRCPDMAARERAGKLLVELRRGAASARESTFIDLSERTLDSIRSPAGSSRDLLQLVKEYRESFERYSNAVTPEH